MSLLITVEDPDVETDLPALPIELGNFRDCSGWWERYCAAGG